jgi:hypothetical protein
LSRTKNIALALGLVVLAGCNFDSDSPTGVQGVTSQSSTGTTGTTASSGAATLTWQVPTENTNGTPLTDLAGYTIVYGSTPEVMDRSVQVTDVGTTSYVLQSLGQGTWYFAILAYTSTGETSALSNVESKTIS